MFSDLDEIGPDLNYLFYFFHVFQLNGLNVEVKLNSILQCKKLLI